MKYFMLILTLLIACNAPQLPMRISVEQPDTLIVWHGTTSDTLVAPCIHITAVHKVFGPPYEYRVQGYTNTLTSGECDCNSGFVFKFKFDADTVHLGDWSKR